MNNKFVSIVIDKEEGSRFLVSDDRSIDTVDLSNDKQTSIARINIKDDITTVCRYENGESKGTISLNIGKEQVKIKRKGNKDEKIFYHRNCNYTCGSRRYLLLYYKK